MKKLYLIARNHMDPSWLRCFTEPFSHPVSGDVIRPYADIEETQILEYMDFAELYGVKYQIEQSFVVKKFLERNPDQFERFRSLVQKGLLELAGGGECVIDCNLTRGESWVRNHLYSRLYYSRAFNHKPKYAITPDIFGLPSQLPQLFRSVGYEALIIFDRVFKNNKPVWKGLDGTPIILDSCFLQPPEPNLRTADCVKLPPCSFCRGAGCEFCRGSGIDATYDMTRPDKELLQSAYYGNMSADVFLETLLKTDKEAYFVMITTEEPPIGGFLFGPLKEAAKRHDMEIIYLGFEENHEVWCSGQEKILYQPEIHNDIIDERIEGNPAAAGCYTSRIEIKKANRELEQLLFEAECLCTAVYESGGFRNGLLPNRAYPQKKLEMLWNKMSFIQFHDCITGSHCDASYAELMRYIMEVRRGVYQIYSDAAFEWCKLHNVQIPEGVYAAVLFNPTANTIKTPRINLQIPDETSTVALFTQNLSPIKSFDSEETKGLVGKCASYRISCPIGPFSGKIVFWKPIKDSSVAKFLPVINDTVTIENESYRVTASQKEILEIYDKRNNRKMLANCAADLCIGDDSGSAYGRAVPETYHKALCADRAEKYETSDYARIVFYGVYTDPKNGVESLRWQQTVTLYPGEEIVRFNTTLNFTGCDTHIFASFIPAIKNDGLLYCEVPFGTMARSDPEKYNLMGITDEWPSLGFAGVSDGEYNIAVLKGGLPGSRLKNGLLEISLLRSVRAEDPKYAGLVDCGRHDYTYAVTSWVGDFAAGNCAARADAFNFSGFTHSITGPGIWTAPNMISTDHCDTEEALLPFLHAIPEGLCISAIKRSEDGKDPVVRIWETRGRASTFTVNNGYLLRKCDSLEKPYGKPDQTAYTFRPFEFSTFRIIRKSGTEA